jgi:radical SAM superfamily enzyme YgiQ (UPF0313 family)
MTILYIHPSKQGTRFGAMPNLGRPYGLIPVGLPAIINMLKQNGFPVKGINHSIEVQLNPKFNLQQWLSQQHEVNIVLIDLHWYEHCYGAMDIAETVKKAIPGVYTILGGLSASRFAREILENFPQVDFIVRGDAEKPLVELAKLIQEIHDPQKLALKLPEIPNLSYRTKEGIAENHLGYTANTTDLDQLDYINLDFLEHDREYLVHEYIVTDLERARKALEGKPFTGRWITTARGCKFECSYCGGCKSAHKVLSGREGLIIRSPEKVANELKRLEQMGVTQACFAYDIAELGDDYWKSLFSLIRLQGIKLGLYNECFQMPSNEFVKEFVQNSIPEHSCLCFSPLSGNERVRRMNGKHFSNAQLFNILDLLSQYETYILIYFSLNLPGETAETILESADLARDIYQFYPNRFLKIINSMHTIDPLSPMSTNAEHFGIQVNMSSFLDFYNYCKETSFQSPGSRTGLHRGFISQELNPGDLEKMVGIWEFERTGKESSWWPIPPGW